ncbi:10350_t:CDS:2 [Ambispora leptoticha]|uniref:10350_t:CDS:1 n=1 Tax=Ambispora leptoticha TaxID=144679 RepID=A0A9N9E2C1_9GLOM|nr:10350_t:CDS:2 [Ambispora leptoticha]
MRPRAQTNATSPSSSSATKKVATREEWEKKLGEVKISKTDLNNLVMNYLVIEGYKDAAEKFSQECGLQPNIDFESIQDRMNIRNAIQNGNILDTNPKLYFHLQQQRLIEYIRQGKTSEALEFAQDELAPRGEENPEFLEELERTMALLAFEDTSQSPVGYLLHPAQRQRTASELNAAILTSQSQDKDPKLPSLLKMLVWAQNQLDEKLSFPQIRNLATAELVEGTTPASNASPSTSNNNNTSTSSIISFPPSLSST